MKSSTLSCAAGMGLLALMAPASAQEAVCVDCISVRVGPPEVVRGPFPDELDAAFAATRLPDGRFRGFSANGATYAVDGATLDDMGGERRAVLDVGPPGSINDCGSWLTSTARADDRLYGFVHQERLCDYDVGRTDKSMAIAVSEDEGLSWTDLGTVITGTDTPLPDQITGEGDCSLVDGHDGFFYAYCLRNSDWQTIVARAPAQDPVDWRKYHEGEWREPGLGGAATDIGFVGTGAGYLRDHDWVAAVATDPWFGGLRLSLSADKVTFVDLDEPLVPIDDANWERPAPTDLSVYATILNPTEGGNTVGDNFVLAYVFVPAGQGFESRYLVLREVSLTQREPSAVPQVGIALTRWIMPGSTGTITTTGPLIGDYSRESTLAYMLTAAPDGAATVKIVECSDGTRNTLAEDGTCALSRMSQTRTAGWLFVDEQPNSVPVFRCEGDSAGPFISTQDNCEGLGDAGDLLGYGLAS
ncbi:hypothetical protein [Devosia sediminis]|uniref:Exo-alpha-sialidase n=1 Tax=Devosia sediminis TaxID=2798801 RepID=A0A934IYK4_9HYPH|nr:hypothetical protein [Devosia sediminis]MBJ3785455.1 hypothetical protein [Devosia sediminis]